MTVLAVQLTRLIKVGSSRACIIPKKLCDSLAWEQGASLALRRVGDKLIVEVVRIDQLCRVGQAALEAHK